jgi:phosphoglycerol transferase
VRALVTIFGGVCLLLLLRVATFAAPIVFGDEMSYGLLAQSLGNAAVYSRNEILQPLPNQLFFDVYHLAALCGEAMLGFGRALNCVLFALAVLPLYALARRFVAQREAVLFAAIVLLLPTNVYTGFFMPESFYFLAFYVVAWAFLAFIAPHGRLRYAVFAGVSLAGLSLIKPHGLTILLACNLTLLVGLCVWRRERRRVLSGWALLLLAFGVGRAILGISDAPLAEGTWLQRSFGLYANFITHTLQVTLDAPLLERLRLAATNNVGATLLLFGAPLAASACWLLRRRVPQEAPDATGLGRSHLFTGITLLCLLIGTIKFTAYIAGADPSQDPARLHERYYDFSFGLLLLCGYASLRALPGDASSRRVGAWLSAGLIFAAALWYTLQVLPTLQASWIDHATLLGAWAWQFHGVFFIALLGVVAALLVPFAPRIALRGYAMFLAFVALGGFAAVVEQGSVSRRLNEFDRAAMTLKALYGPRELEHGLVISSADNMAPLFHVSFALRNNVTMRLLPPESPIEPAALAPDAQWILAYGQHAIDGDGWDAGLPLPAHATLYRRVSR